MSANELQVELPCECGRTVTARPRDAGNGLPCSCGRTVVVPNLSKLRTLAGKDAYVTNPADAIRKMLHDGIRPAGERCILCGSTTPVFHICHAVCERTFEKPMEDNEQMPMPMMVAVADYLIVRPLIWLLFRRSGAKTTQIVGHEVAVTFPLPVCGPCAKANGDVTRPKVAMRLIEHVPAYKELLAYYPEMELSVERPNS